MTDFEIHPQLKSDCFVLGRLNLSYLLLMNDSNYPWFILVPARKNVKEIFQLKAEDQQELLKEITTFSQLLSDLIKPEKINIAALGNVVPQLHIHIICRYKDDRAWPAPVWGRVPYRPYTDEKKNEIISKIKNINIPGLELTV